MIDVSPLSKQVDRLIEDLEARLTEDAELTASLRRAFEQATERERTGKTEVEWREEYLTQIAVGWVLTCLFVRYLEDHELIPQRLVGERAREHQRAYFQQPDHRADSDTDYLLALFEELDRPGHPAGELFGPERNPLYKMRISGDAARELLAFWREVDADTGERVWDLSQEPDTRFLGDVYQDLSEDVRKKYALLQTPEFVESYILDYTLEPAIEEFGLDEVRFLDPTCGSGHFLLGGFRRIYKKLKIARPSERPDVLVRQALEATHGVDINPFAVAIARFRLSVEAMQLCGYGSFLELPELPLRVACGDSLLLGELFDSFERDTSENKRQAELFRHRWDDELSTEDNDLIYGPGGQGGILTQQYHAVVGNPPYITVKDKGARDAYRMYYASCYRKYALVSPFYERFFDLALPASREEGGQMKLGKISDSSTERAGYVGMIVANSFMKRSFGQKLIKEIMPKTDLSHVIDTSGAYIPGHGTPTIILIGRNREPTHDKIRSILGIRGEPKTPEDPSSGKVWSSIRNNTDSIGFENDFITVTNSDRDVFSSHPWSLQGGGALECKTLIESDNPNLLENLTEEIGFGVITGEDECFTGKRKSILRRQNIPNELLKNLMSVKK